MSTEELNFEEYAPAKTPFLTQAGFAATALVLSALPVHTFTQIYYLEFEAAALTYIIMTLFSAALLYMSYINVNASQSNILAHNGRITIGNHKALKMDKKVSTDDISSSVNYALSIYVLSVIYIFSSYHVFLPCHTIM